METDVVTAEVIAQFRRHGYAVLRGVVDADLLTAEVIRCLEDAFKDDAARNTGRAGNSFRYVPMMCGLSPLSLALVGTLTEWATRLAGATAIPVRAKGTRYFGSTAWHRDSDRDMVSIGFLAYLDPLVADTGALRIVPGSHRGPYTTVAPAVADAGSSVIASQPGDLLVIDEHLLHASSGGEERLQWRVDFIADPVTPSDEATVRTYLSGIFQSGWDGGYDVDRYPSFGPEWQRSGLPGVERLRRLGVYEMAESEERAVLAARARTTAEGPGARNHPGVGA